MRNILAAFFTFKALAKNLFWGSCFLRPLQLSVSYLPFFLLSFLFSFLFPFP